jgi:hypothetical protein
MAATAAPAATLGWDQVAAWRAARHRLDVRVPATAMLEVAGRIAGLHAQVMSSAELPLWQAAGRQAPRELGGPAMAEVTRRFLAASGPVTREDFARARRAAEAEAERLAAWSGSRLELRWAAG